MLSCLVLKRITLAKIEKIDKILELIDLNITDKKSTVSSKQTQTKLHQSKLYLTQKKISSKILNKASKKL